MNKFGIEFEYCQRMIDNHALFDRLIEAVGEFYYSGQIWSNKNHYRKTYKIRPSNKYWNLKRDASCGYEISSKVLQTSPKGIEDLRRITEILVRSHHGQFPTSPTSCGLHIHINRRFLQESTIANFLRFLYLASPTIYEVLNSEHRTANRYGAIPRFCPPERQRFLTEKLQELGTNQAFRRKTRHGTVEIRMSRGLHNTDQIIAYVQFLLIIMSICKGIHPKHFKYFYNSRIFESFFTKLDILEFLSQKTAHPWLEERKIDTLKTLKII